MDVRLVAGRAKGASPLVLGTRDDRAGAAMSSGHRRRAAQLVGGLVAAAVCLTACTSASEPSTARGITETITSTPVVAVAGVTPKGWVPVDYGDAQVSVPSSWSLEDLVGNVCPYSRSPGTILLGWPAPKGSCHYVRTRPGTTVVNFRPPRPPSAWHGELPHLVNGIPTYHGDGNDWVIDAFSGRPNLDLIAPLLGVEVVAVGPLAAAVLRTLTFSPRAVVLAKGTSPKVPQSSRRLTFGGLRFAVPSSWPVYPTSQSFISCFPEWTNVFSGFERPLTAVYLSTDTQGASINCPIEMSFPPAAAPTDGLRLDLRWRWPGGSSPALVFSRQCLAIHDLRVCPSSSLDYSVLFAAVHVPGRTTPVTLMLGTAADGQVARTILYSLRPA